MSKQPAFAGRRAAMKKRVTRRAPMPLETMLRVYMPQNGCALSDPMAPEPLYGSEAMRRFAGIELGEDRIADETSILIFRHLLEGTG